MAESTVRDVMIPLSEYATIDAGATVREALQALDRAQLGLDADRQHHRAVLALDRRGDVVGKLSHWAVLRALEPDPFRQQELDQLERAGLTDEQIQTMRRDAIRQQESLAQMCRKAGRVRVREAMVPVGDSIDASAPLVDAVRKLVSSHTQSLLVTERGQAAGVLRLSDVFEAIAERIRSGECCS